ncbi:MAG TPA: SET domain-containing protein-lysine N-methyltransferase, partial [Spirochaetia bacterium]|nr:SET domain-containing protein-lysine N-methyltransferase [Spirochaetia bacterium]
TSPTTYALQIGPDLYIGASGGLDDYINHSCEPNAGLRISGTTVDLYAIRDIKPGEEILFDYSTTLDEDDFTMSCQCSTPSCRRVIRDGKYLPPEVWQRYLLLGIVPEYVQRSRAALA